MLNEEYGIPSDKQALGIGGHWAQMPEGYKSEEDYGIPSDKQAVGISGHWAQMPEGYKSEQDYGIPSDKQAVGISHGPEIDGRKPGDLIRAGILTPETMKKENESIVYDDILLGLTNTPELLAKKIDLIINNKELINQMVKQQYLLAIKEMKKEQQNLYELNGVNRKFQFLSTTKILMEKGYDISSLEFESENKIVGLAELLSSFKKACTQYQAKRIPDPSWFKSGEMPVNYDIRKINNPYLFAGVLIGELYYSNPKEFQRKYEQYKLETKRLPEERLSYEEFIHYGYSLDLTINDQYLESFKASREKQQEIDREFRNQKLSEINSFKESKSR